jgi:hypothetical protein
MGIGVLFPRLCLGLEPLRPSKAGKAEIPLVYVHSLNYKAEKAEIALVYVYSLNYKAEKTLKALVYVCCWFPGPPNLYICMVLEGLGRREVPERTKGGTLLLQ